MTTNDHWTVFRWTPQSPEPAFRLVPTDPSRASGAQARVDLWINSDGLAQGWMSLDFGDQLPKQVELKWPESAHPLALFLDGQFRRFPTVENGRIVISMPSALKERRIWLAWSEQIGALPVVSRPLAARIPWPQDLVFEPCRVSLHAPAGVLFTELSPSLRRDSLSQTIAPPPIASRDGQTPESESAAVTTLLAVPVPPPGQALNLSDFVKLSRAGLKDWTVAVCASILVLLTLRKTGAAWRWLEAHDTAAWLLLALIWWLVLTPSWLGPVLAIWAFVRAISTRSKVRA
jgi:hypothetical protein